MYKCACMYKYSHCIKKARVTSIDEQRRLKKCIFVFLLCITLPIHQKKLLIAVRYKSSTDIFYIADF